MKHATALLSFALAAPCGFLLTAALRPSLEAKREASAAAAAPIAVSSREAPGVSPAAAPALATPPPVLKTAADVDRLFDGEDYGKAQAELWEALQTMDAPAVAALAKDLALISNSNMKAALFSRAVWDRWVRLDPEAVAAYWPLIGNFRSGMDAAESLVSHFAGTDPEKLERMIRRGGGLAQSGAKQALLQKLAETDPAKAAEEFKRPFYSDVNTMMGRGIAMKWAERDPEAALAWARTLSTERERNEALTAVLRTQTEKDPAGAARMLSSAPPDQRPALCAALAEGWTATDDVAALTWLSSLEDPAELQQAREGYLRAKVRKNGAEATAFLQTVPEGAEREALRYRVLETAGYVPNNSTAELLRDAPPGAALDRERAQKIAQQMPGTSEQTLTVLPWALRLERDDAATAAAGAMISRVDEKGLPEASRQIDTLEDPARRLSLREELSQRWAFLNLPAAETWMRTLPAEEQPEVIKKMLHWAKPGEAVPLLQEMLNSTPVAANDPVWQEQTQRFFSRWSYEDIPAAAASALQLPPGESRQAALQAVERRWTETDVNASAAWRETLSPEDRALLPERTR